MATRASHKRLTREYQNIQESPPEYIVAHPSENNILEWHYIITGPPDTPYHGGQYWGVLQFPPEYPFAPPAIRMHTPSGRFECSARICLTISDFHPKSFNPAWKVSTILVGVLSYMTSEEMATGTIKVSDAERKALAAKSRWWNSTGGGSSIKSTNERGAGGIKAGDGGKKFKQEFPELDAENWKLLESKQIDRKTGNYLELEQPESLSSPKAAQTTTTAQAPGGTVQPPKVVPQQSWLQRNKLYLIGGALFAYVLVARMLRDHQE